MNSLIIVAIMFIGYIAAYHTYGKYLANRIFRIDVKAICPSEELRDDMDYIPTNRQVLFGHHFTSIAGLGPIVGPAIAIIWGWVPAVIWVLLGSIFMGAVHDFGSLVVSLRGQGRSIGELASEIINSRVRTLFLLIIFFELWIVIAVFALIIAILFTSYPQAVLAVWLEVPLALGLGYLVYKRGKDHTRLGIAAVVIMYVTVVIGTYIPLNMPSLFGVSPLAIWIVILLIYAYIASTLPVQTLLQPRDYINSHQLMIAMTLLILGVLVARPPMVAPPFNPSPAGAPPLWPFLFVVIACGAISGFHSLVSSGTSSKQCDNEKSSLFIGYGGMLLEGALAALVIVSVAAGLGMGLPLADGQVLRGLEAFNHHYSNWAAASGLSAKLGSFVTGAANMIETIGIPARITITIMGVFLVSFAATTMDSATRIQRYVVNELAEAWNIRALQGKHKATTVAVVSAFILAFYNGSGKGALTLWPLFGSVNQLLAGLALLVITIYLAKRKIKVIYTTVPMVFMIFMTGWAMILNLESFFRTSNWLLLVIGLAVLVLELWMIVESALVLKKVYLK
ncbi:carbon starvation protein A [candidate division CSSED10-310 bacterium]|uniref:Carbon starvation protein A n=1 Tax=candidate division CSSED10-310 bacterium TaxID=2855610 RepID=A0ABV6Z469_UNCC1